MLSSFRDRPSTLRDDWRGRSVEAWIRRPGPGPAPTARNQPGSFVSLFLTIVSFFVLPQSLPGSLPTTTSGSIGTSNVFRWLGIALSTRAHRAHFNVIRTTYSVQRNPTRHVLISKIECGPGGRLAGLRPPRESLDAFECMYMCI